MQTAENQRNPAGEAAKKLEEVAETCCGLQHALQRLEGGAVEHKEGLKSIRQVVNHSKIIAKRLASRKDKLPGLPIYEISMVFSMLYAPFLFNVFWRLERVYCSEEVLL